MEQTPRANRIHIGIYGRCNSGKSSLINAITGQQTAVVSEVAGTTTDTVNKSMELPGVGAVTFIDTAGFDDTGELGAKRLEQTRKAADRTDVAVIVHAGGEPGAEREWIGLFGERNIPVVLVLNKADLLAFAAIRGKNEYLPVYSITPDAANPSTGIIKDNNGLSCRYCLSKDLTALSTATLTTTATKHMFYGNPQCAELALWGGFEVEVNEGYKFAEGLLTVRGEVTADVDVTVKNGFVVVTAKKAAA